MVRLPKRIVSTEGLTRGEKLAVMKERQGLMAVEALRLLERRGYVLGESLRVRGSCAFCRDPRGEPHLHRYQDQLRSPGRRRARRIGRVGSALACRGAVRRHLRRTARA